MIIGTVTGTIHSTIGHEFYRAKKLLIVEREDGRSRPTGSYLVAIDTVGAGVGERVLVAWNASRAATRAVNDALPMLQKAKQVTVLAINPRGGVSGEGDVPGADLALHLSRHGVKAEAAWLKAADIEVGAMLLSRASDFQSDLIVMGGYGHSRLREIVLGGATREILQTMTVPTLMSH